MLFQLFFALSARCQITSTGSRAWCSLHLSGIFPDRKKKGAWDSRTREGLGLNEHFKCWSQVIGRSLWDRQRTVGSRIFFNGWFSADFQARLQFMNTWPGVSRKQNEEKMNLRSPMNSCLFFDTVGSNKKRLWQVRGTWTEGQCFSPELAKQPWTERENRRFLLQNLQNLKGKFIEF